MIFLFGTDTTRNMFSGSVIAQAVSCQLHICSGLVHVGFVVNKMSLRQVSFRKLRFSFASYYSINVPYSSIISTVGAFIGPSTKGLFFLNLHSGGWSPNWVHLARRPLTGLLYLPRVIVRMENLVE
jgi:hypothetical protein